MSLIETEGLTKKFGDLTAVDSLTLHVNDGEVFGFLGPNGAGKTTLMRIMAGLENADSGQLLFNNQNIDCKSLRQVTTLVFQKSAMFSTNIYENLAYGLKIRKVPKEDIKKKIADALQAVRLSGFEKRRAKKTSGGEQQRIALARAFLLESNVLLLDEPTANLDPNSASIIEKAIVSRKSSDRIIVIATHNLTQARRIADEIVHIHDGKIVEAADVINFFENPKSEISRKFVNGELEF